MAGAGVAERPQDDLDVFRLWYNHARSHQHLDGLTPAQAWAGKTAGTSAPQLLFFSAWDDLLTGVYRRT